MGVIDILRAGFLIRRKATASAVTKALPDNPKSIDDVISSIIGTRELINRASGGKNCTVLMPPASQIPAGTHTEEVPSYIFVNKPLGMSMHNLPNYDLVSTISKELNIAKEKIKIIHRLDMQTSGVVLAALEPKTAAFFHRQFASKQVLKKYRCVVFNKLSDTKEKSASNEAGVRESEVSSGATAIEEGDDAQQQQQQQQQESEPVEDIWRLWDFPLTKTQGSKKSIAGEESQRVPSFTRYRVLKRTRLFSLLECVMVTSRVHQIRRHAALAGTPIVGDIEYGSKRKNRHITKLIGKGRIALHSSSLTVREPPATLLLEDDSKSSAKSKENTKQPPAAKTAHLDGIDDDNNNDEATGFDKLIEQVDALLAAEAQLNNNNNNNNAATTETTTSDGGGSNQSFNKTKGKKKKKKKKTSSSKKDESAAAAAAAEAPSTSTSTETPLVQATDGNNSWITVTAEFPEELVALLTPGFEYYLAEQEKEFKELKGKQKLAKKKRQSDQNKGQQHQQRSQQMNQKKENKQKQQQQLQQQQQQNKNTRTAAPVVDKKLLSAKQNQKKQ